MYYPYLRGKQFELKAIRDFFEVHDTDKIVPIIEPVNEATTALDTMMCSLISSDKKFALILNPYEGDFSHGSVSVDGLLGLECLKEVGKWIPAFLCNIDTEGVMEMMEAHDYHDCMLIFPDTINITDENVKRLIVCERVRYLVGDNGSFKSGRVSRFLRSLDKQKIWLDNCFRSQKKNADYKNMEDEDFSLMPFDYQVDGYDGFSDYTALNKDFVEGGMMPYALAIHLTYEADDEIRIHHFVSDHNSDQSNIRGKFKEAAEKIALFYAGKERTDAVTEFISRAIDEENGYPGLGYIKKLSILNHFELMNRILQR